MVVTGAVAGTGAGAEAEAVLVAVEVAVEAEWLSFALMTSDSFFFRELRRRVLRSIFDIIEASVPKSFRFLLVSIA